MAELKTYKQKVRQIMIDHEPARSNDGTLIAHYISKHSAQYITKDSDGNLAVPLKNFQHLPSFENIRRARAIIQNDNNELLPTKASVRKARKIKEENWRNCEVREAIAV